MPSHTPPTDIFILYSIHFHLTLMQRDLGTHVRLSLHSIIVIHRECGAKNDTRRGVSRELKMKNMLLQYTQCALTYFLSCQKEKKTGDIFLLKHFFSQDMHNFNKFFFQLMKLKIFHEFKN